MGDYTIIIEGHGMNQNGGDPKDADQIARETMRRLLEAGHKDVRALFVYGYHGVSNPEGSRGATLHLEPTPAPVSMEQLRAKAALDEEEATPGNGLDS